ncbi:OmpA family protein [Nocardiopsis sinuspersici]|uniref:OmpA family protein n=2 Tax=Nocardiopsidaceae TaxID=83676 RepID=UPI0009889F08|nr:OmpA family protein [Nocardiopsis sinuspersici]
MAAILLSSGCVVSSPDHSGNGNSNPDQETGSSTPSSPQPDGTENKVIASSTTSSTSIGGDYQIDIYALETVGDNLLRLQIGVTNHSDSDYFLQDGLSDFENPYTANRITLLDSKNQTRHLSFTQKNGACFCSQLNENIPAGGSADMWVIFPQPPDDVESMAVTTPLTPPIFDVPISSSSETLENSGLADPEIIPMTMISDNTEDNTGRTESGDEVSIILSSDVLFETNSADLSPDARDIIDQVAMEINEASSSTVNIDGYADNTGSDSVNIPLSQERAEAVESILADLVTREGVTFEVKGHGSADPIGDNATEEGRERNRRVSVTFEK